MSATGESAPTLVLTGDVVRWGIDWLESRPIHPFFLAYLHLRKWSQEAASTSHVQPRWGDELPLHMEVEGAPPTKPYFRPLATTKVKNPGNYWMNRNLAGSFAPSSVRGVPQRVVEPSDSGTFNLREDHAALALEHFLFGKRVSALAFAAYWYRDFGFQPTAMSVQPVDLAGALAQQFAFTDEDDDWDTLFDLDMPSGINQWFEVLRPDDEGASVWMTYLNPRETA